MNASGNTSNCAPRPAASAISASARSMVAGVSSRTVAVCATAAVRIDFAMVCLPEVDFPKNTPSRLRRRR